MAKDPLGLLEHGALAVPPVVTGVFVDQTTCDHETQMWQPMRVILDFKIDDSDFEKEITLKISQREVSGHIPVAIATRLIRPDKAS